MRRTILNTCVIRVYGIVQGVGFRPFVSRTCLENNIKGSVSNKGSYVE
ncbi:MAG: acylphosphatase, partial [Lachnospiraceae bacterium]|nr:acylphosphatase [Lachnospiraceae bacterium]